MKTGTGRTKYGHKREGNTGHGKHRSDITPPSRTPSNGEGGGGALEASRDTETGQEASRAAPVLGLTAERGARAAMAYQGARAAMVDPGARAAMADRGARAAMAGPPLRPRPQPRPGALLPPPKKNSLGKVGARSGTWGVLWTRENLGVLWKRGLLGALWKRGHWRRRALHSAFEGLALEGAL